jgi:hypothetical protein
MRGKQLIEPVGELLVAVAVVVGQRSMMADQRDVPSLETGLFRAVLRACAEPDTHQPMPLTERPMPLGPFRNAEAFNVIPSHEVAPVHRCLINPFRSDHHTR